MATLVSPGVDVEIIDESAYSSAGPGTVPLVILATASNKVSPSGSGVAPYTIQSQAGSLYLATSQRDLIQNFGTPNFKVVSGTPVHGYELNEYGLLAAYQYLGISNQCYVLRADIDLSQLEASTSAPVGAPQNGTYWLNLSTTSFGVFQSNGNPSAGLAWTTQPVIVAGEGSVVTDQNNLDTPAPTLGNDGQFAVVVTMSDNLIYEKISGSWYAVGSPAWAAQRPTTVSGKASPSPIQTTDTIVIDGTTVSFAEIPTGNGGQTAGTGALSEIITAINAAAISNVTASLSNTGGLVITDSTGATLTIANGNGTPLTTLGISPGTYAGVQVYMTNNAQYPANSVAGSVWIKGSQPNNGANWTLSLYSAATATWSSIATPHYPYNSSMADGQAAKDLAATAAFGTPSVGAVYVGYDTTNYIQQLRRWNGTSWSDLSYEAGTIAPTTAPPAGTYWFNTDYQIDIMYGNGSEWLGYQRKFPQTDPGGVQIAGSAPTTQSTGAALVDNDLWVDSSNLENYPMVYRWDATLLRWNLISNTDNTSPFGIVFADARQDSGTNYTNNPNAGTYLYNSTAQADLLKSNFVDPDAPDPRTYPDGMLLFNTRFSNNNVKVWNPTYFNAGGFDPNTDYTNTTYNIGSTSVTFPALANAGRWVTASGNDVTGAPFMGRKAQRVMVTRAMEAMVSDNQDIRSEIVYFNLMAAPGYPELLTEMIALNVDQKQVSFIVGDTPIRLASDATSVTNWATNALNVASTGESGLTVSDDYTGIYYPWGLSTDLSGYDAMMPPSAIALCTLAYNDQVSYPWFAPAGYKRGLVTNASSVGYLNSAGSYVPTILNQGQRDTLYTNKINPIAYIPGRGLVVYGQKTLEPTGTSALDRINVARLCNYLKYNLDTLVKPFLFEQNDVQTQASAQALVSNFLNGLVGLQALTDYAVVCDSTNNTPTRVDAGELWIDIAIQPIHAIEFIYVPVRILNSGADASTQLASDISSSNDSTSIS